MKHCQQYVQALIIAHGKAVRIPNKQLEIGKANLNQIKINKIVNKF